LLRMGVEKVKKTALVGQQASEHGSYCYWMVTVALHFIRPVSFHGFAQRKCGVLATERGFFSHSLVVPLSARCASLPTLLGRMNLGGDLRCRLAD
jgi:hypothetical protein